jgi:glycosyltransferase involved in cell wall biosynthesis
MTVCEPSYTALFFRAAKTRALTNGRCNRAHQFRLPSTDLHAPTFEPRGGYLAFLGRISPEKGPDSAITFAHAAGIPLKIAAKVDKADEAYFRESILPLLDGPGVEFLGEIEERAKTKFLGQASALLFPIDWPEPFGLAMIEAMACGTPVLAFRRGSVPEVIDAGVTGEIVETIEEAILALPRVLSLDRRKVRQRFEQRFSAKRMAEDYVNVYRALLRESKAEEFNLRRQHGATRIQSGSPLFPVRPS